MNLRAVDIAIAGAAILLVGAVVWVFALPSQEADSAKTGEPPPAAAPGPTATIAAAWPTSVLAESTPTPAPPANNEPSAPSTASDGPSNEQVPPPPPSPTSAPPAPPTPTPVPARSTPPREELHFQPLHYEILSDGINVYVYFENYSRDWSACDLVYSVRVQDFSGSYHDGSQVYVGTLAPQQVTDPVASFVPGIDSVAYYEVLLDWTWC